MKSGWQTPLAPLHLKGAIVLDAVLQELPAELLSGHFHDTNRRDERIGVITKVSPF